MAKRRRGLLQKSNKTKDNAKAIVVMKDSTKEQYWKIYRLHIVSRGTYKQIQDQLKVSDETVRKAIKFVRDNLIDYTDDENLKDMIQLCNARVREYRTEANNRERELENGSIRKLSDNEVLGLRKLIKDYEFRAMELMGLIRSDININNNTLNVSNEYKGLMQEVQDAKGSERRKIQAALEKGL